LGVSLLATASLVEQGLLYLSAVMLMGFNEILHLLGHLLWKTDKSL